MAKLTRSHGRRKAILLTALAASVFWLPEMRTGVHAADQQATPVTVIVQSAGLDPTIAALEQEKSHSEIEALKDHSFSLGAWLSRYGSVLIALLAAAWAIESWRREHNFNAYSTQKNAYNGLPSGLTATNQRRARTQR